MKEQNFQAASLAPVAPVAPVATEAPPAVFHERDTGLLSTVAVVGRFIVAAFSEGFRIDGIDSKDGGSGC